MRVVLSLVGLVVAMALGAVQFVSAVALRERAVGGSWVRLVPEDVARRVERVDPGWPMPQILLEVLARRALEEGDVRRAAEVIAHLDRSEARLVLEGQVDEARGDSAAADRAYLAAGDLADVERHVDVLRRHWENGAAIALQLALVARMSGDRTQRDTLANAYYGLGQVEEDAAYRYGLASPMRAQHEQEAGIAYENAVEIAPGEERYLLAYANQLLNLQRFEDARTVFLKARDIDVTRPEPVAGLGQAALLLGDRAGAYAYLARARAIDARSEAVVRLARALGA